MTSLGFGQGSLNHQGFPGLTELHAGSCPSATWRYAGLPDFTRAALGSPAPPPKPQPAGRCPGIARQLQARPGQAGQPAAAQAVREEPRGRIETDTALRPPSAPSGDRYSQDRRKPGRRVAVETRRRKQCAAPGRAGHTRRK